MPVHTLGPGDGLYFEHQPPTAPGGVTFTCFNPLTGDTGAWDAAVGPALRAKGHGTLLWNFRGQKDSAFSDPAAINPAQIVTDSVALIQAVAPARPVHVGLSIGGLFAAQAHLAGAACEALLLINTLRAPSVRLDWTNAAVYRAAVTGGPRMIGDLFMQHLTGPAWQAANHANFLKDEPYQPLDPASGTARLLAAGMEADWSLAYEQLSVPVTVLSGLRDRVFFDAVDVATLAARLPDAQRVDLPDIGHLVTMEQPQAVIDACFALVGRLAD